MGYARAENFVSPERLARDGRRIYSLPAHLDLNKWGFSGAWNAGPERSTLEVAPGKIVFRFHGRDLHMVLVRPKTGAGSFQGEVEWRAAGRASRVRFRR